MDWTLEDIEPILPKYRAGDRIKLYDGGQTGTVMETPVPPQAGETIWYRVHLDSYPDDSILREEWMDYEQEISFNGPTPANSWDFEPTGESVPDTLPWSDDEQNFYRTATTVEQDLRKTTARNWDYAGIFWWAPSSGLLLDTKYSETHADLIWERSQYDPDIYTDAYMGWIFKSTRSPRYVAVPASMEYNGNPESAKPAIKALREHIPGITLSDAKPGMYQWNDYGESMDYSEGGLPALDLQWAPRKSAVAFPANYTDTDPLDLEGKKPLIEAMNTEWWNLDPQEQKQAIINAFRATMLSPRMNLKSNAILYQTLMDIPADESDPDVFEQRVRETKQKWDAQGQMGLEQNPEDVFAQDEILPGKFMPGFWGNVRRLAELGPYADDIWQAATTDMQNGGTGEYFRDAILKLNIPGVGAKVGSFAWLALAPMTSELATVDVHMMKHLERDYDSPKSTAEYLELEQELKRQRDEMYGPETPLAWYQWGVWDKRRTPGYHQDHTPLRAYEPVDYRQVDWATPARPPRPVKRWIPPEEQLRFAAKQSMKIEYLSGPEVAMHHEPTFIYDIDYDTMYLAMEGTTHGYILNSLWDDESKEVSDNLIFGWYDGEVHLYQQDENQNNTFQVDPTWKDKFLPIFKTAALVDQEGYDPKALYKGENYVLNGRLVKFVGPVFKNTWKPPKMWIGEAELDYIFDSDGQYMRMTMDDIRTFREQGQLIHSPEFQEDAEVEKAPDTIPWGEEEQDYYRTSGMTRPQQIREWERFDGPNRNFQIMFEFPDGWKIMQAMDNNAAGTIGKFMRNCWANQYNSPLGWESGTRPWPSEGAGGWMRYQALFDPDGLPVVAWRLRPVWPYQEDKLEIDSPLAARNDYATQEHMQKVYEWAATLSEETYTMLGGDYVPIGLNPEEEASKYWVKKEKWSAITYPEGHEPPMYKSGDPVILHSDWTQAGPDAPSGMVVNVEKSSGGFDWIYSIRWEDGSITREYEYTILPDSLAGNIYDKADQASQAWPDTIPWEEDEQNYYRSAALNLPWVAEFIDTSTQRKHDWRWTNGQRPIIYNFSKNKAYIGNPGDHHAELLHALGYTWDEARDLGFGTYYPFGGRIHPVSGPDSPEGKEAVRRLIKSYG